MESEFVAESAWPYGMEEVVVHDPGCSCCRPTFPVYTLRAVLEDR